MIIGQHHANVAHDSGNEATTWPPVGVGPALNDPPSSAARSRIALSPTPGAHAPFGGPSSVIDNSSRSPNRSRTRASVALEWRTTLVRASVAIRYVATSIAPGNVRTSSA